MRAQATAHLHTPDDTTGVPSGELIDELVCAASFNTAPFFMGAFEKMSIFLMCPATGAPVWAVKVQGCDDATGQNNSEVGDIRLTNWVDVAFYDDSTGARVVSQPISGASTIHIEDTDFCFRWMRLVFTRTSGSMTLTATIQFKGNTA